MLGPHDFTFVSGLVFRPKTLDSFPLVSTCLRVHSGCSECSGPDDFTLVSQLSPTTLWILCPHDFTLVSNLSRLVSQHTLDALSIYPGPQSPSKVSCSYCSGPHDFQLVSHFASHYTGFSARMISPLSSGLPVKSGCSECSGPHDLALVSHWSPTTLDSLAA